MQTINSKRMSSFFLCILLTLSITFLTSGCSSNTQNEAPSTSVTDINTSSDVTVLGEGNTIFEFTVTDIDKNTTQFEIHTDKETVGEALLELGIIAGDDSEFGLYVKTVNGITVDYDTDGKYWAFYINGEYATTGVDSTPITEGASYSFKAE